MKMSKEEYKAYAEKHMPRSKVSRNMLRAFVVGGAICCLGQFLLNVYMHVGFEEKQAASLESVSLVFIGALLTGLGIYDDIAKFAGAGTLVPITGFANSVVSPALEFKTEGFITGTAAKMFVISGPVIVYGVCAGTVYGFIYWIMSLF